MKTIKLKTSEIITAEQILDVAWQALRDERDRRLTASDWTQVADAPVDADAWMRYRQELRDLPETITDPTKVIWPAEPARTT